MKWNNTSLLTVLLLCVLSTGFSHASDDVICHPDLPVAPIAGKVKLNFWVINPKINNYTFQWEAAAGEIKTENSTTIWHLHNVQPGIGYESTIVITDKNNNKYTCNLTIIIKYPSLTQKGRSRLSRRDYLLPKQVQLEEYGLYSYLLFGSRPDSKSRPRYLKAIEEWLRFSPVSERERQHNRLKKTINITYLPLTKRPGPKVDDLIAKEKYPAAAEKIIGLIDYERSERMLNRLPGKHRSGPYFVSVQKPFRLDGNPVKPMLFQDHSWSDPDFIWLWVRAFLNQAEQQKYWQENKLEQFSINLRQLLRVMSYSFAQVRKANEGLSGDDLLGKIIFSK